MEITPSNGHLDIIYHGVVYPIGNIKDTSLSQWGYDDVDEIPYLELFFAINQLSGIFGIDGSASIKTLLSLGVFVEVPMSDSFELFSRPSDVEYQVLVSEPDNVRLWPKVVNHVSTICVTSQIATLNILTNSYQSVSSHKYELGDVKREASNV